jgi:septum site-determining protein MinC
VYAEQNDLIVLGPVNPGAQLIADGNIHVYSRLRGRAVAGAHGATDARIYCQRLEAELIGIDSAYLSTDDIPQERWDKPAEVFLQSGRCVVRPL